MPRLMPRTSMTILSSSAKDKPAIRCVGDPRRRRGPTQKKRIRRDAVCECLVNTTSDTYLSNPENAQIQMPADAMFLAAQKHRWCSLRRPRHADDAACMFGNHPEFPEPDWADTPQLPKKGFLALRDRSLVYASIFTPVNTISNPPLMVS